MTDALFEELLADRPIEPYRLTGVEQTDGWLCLGQTAIALDRPVWRFDAQGFLADSARYYAHLMEPNGLFLAGALLIFFRQFDRSSTEEQPADYYAGWVPLTEEDAGLEMVAQMNRQLDCALTHKVVEAHDVGDCPACEEGSIGPGPNVRREARGDRYVLVGTLVCTSCGHRGALEAALRFPVDVSLPGQPLMRD